MARSVDTPKPSESVDPPALTPKREATRQAILDAALRLFADKGYHRTTVPDIVKEAGVGHGTFYGYFGNRRDLLMELMSDATERANQRAQISPSSVTERIRLEIHWYLITYVENLELQKVWEEASTFDSEISDQRRKLREARLARVQRGIEAVARPGVDTKITASALNAMLEEFAYRWFVLGEGDGSSAKDVFAAADTLATLWISAIGAHENES